MSAEESHDRELERRGAAAAADLHRVADAREVPPFDPAGALGQIDLEPAAERRRPLLAAAATVIVLAGGVAVWLAGTGTGDQGPADQVTTGGGVRPFVLPEPPEGYELSFFLRVPAGGEAPAERDALTLYGPSLDGAGLGVSVSSGETSVYSGRPGEPVSVGDETWQLYEQPRSLVGQFGDQKVRLLSRELSRDQLVTVAETASLAGGSDASINVDVLPDGWRRVGRTDTVDTPPTPAFLSDYAPSDANEEQITVSSAPGDRASLAAYSLFFPEPERLSVRGGPGVLFSDPSSSGGALFWIERPGEMVQLQVFDSADLDILSLAESLQPISDERADELQRRSRLGDLNPDERNPEVGRGIFGDGTHWVLRQNDLGRPSVDLRVAPASGVVTDLGPPVAGTHAALVSSTRVLAGSRDYIGGLITDDVARVEVEPAEGEPRPVPIVEGGGYRGWAAPVPEGDATVIARAADGTELDRATLRD